METWRAHSRIETPRTVLILKPSSFGDIVHTLPAVARLRSAWPGSRFSWLVNTEWMPLLRGNPDIDEIIPFPRQTFRGVAGSIRFLQWCRESMMGRQPDLALDFQGLLRTALIGRLAGARRFYGLADAREGARWLYQRAAPVPPGVPHAVERYLALAEFVLSEASKEEPVSARTELAFSLPPGEVPEELAERLQSRFILLHPFARGTGKSFTDSQVAAFCRQLTPRQVVLIGRRGGNGADIPPAAIDLLDRTSLAELIWIIRRAACVISVDSGPAHLAAALGKPLVAIHTWSDPRRVGPYRSNAWVWKNGRLLTMSQRSDQEETFFQQSPTAMSAADIQAISALAISLSDSSA